MSKYAMPSFEVHYIGDCGRCCDKGVGLFIIPGYESVCQSCLENDFDICSRCGTIWESDAIDWTISDDGDMLCEDCADELSDEEDFDSEEQQD